MSLGVPCRCFVINTPLELAKHLNYVRQNQTNGDVRRIPEVGYNVYKKNFSAPTKEEGFCNIIQIDFIPKFDSKRDEALFKQWTSAERWWECVIWNPVLNVVLFFTPLSGICVTFSSLDHSPIFVTRTIICVVWLCIFKGVSACL